MAIFFKNRIWIIYVLGWLFIAVFHYIFLVAYLNWQTSRALADSFVYNSVFSLLGAGVWFTVRYPGSSPRPLGYLILVHLAGALLTVGIWLAVSDVILETIFQNEPAINIMQWGIRIPEGFLLYSLLIVVFYLILKVNELNVRIKKEMNLTAMLREAELNMLRSQIKPHFLFNSLNSISALTLSNPALAQEMVIKLSEFMRYSINFPESAMSTLEKELHHCNLYLEIERVRFNDKMVIENQCDPACFTWEIPAMILQPLVENAVKHGVYESQERTVIRLNTCCDDSFLYITIGNRFDADIPSRKGTGTGITNITQRLAAVYNRFDLIKITKAESYFEVLLKIPRTH